jgi:exopolyphosphatase/guanosine-5'-triphosphate,3'-diphosphate pyrophosphatase
MRLRERIRIRRPGVFARTARRKKETAMKKKGAGKVVSVIDIGSNMLRMRLSQLSKGALEHLDVLERPIKSGMRCFSPAESAWRAFRIFPSI